MTTIVMNTLTGAVSEYDWRFASLTSTHAGSEDGLFELGGDDDDGVPIAALITTPKTLQGGETLKTRMETAFLTIHGAAGTWGEFHVHGQTDSWAYPVEVAASGLSRAKPGRGIRENFLGFGYSNVDGAPFRLDRIEVIAPQSVQRRV